MAGEGGSSPPYRQSPYSPFPFGSPLGMSDRSVSTPSNGRSSRNNTDLPSAGVLATNFSNTILKSSSQKYGGK